MHWHTRHDNDAAQLCVIDTKHALQSQSCLLIELVLLLTLEVGRVAVRYQVQSNINQSILRAL